MCRDPALSNKKEYPTFARTFSDWTPALIKVLQKFNWNTVALIYTGNNKYRAAKQYITNELDNSKNRITVFLDFEIYEDIDRPDYKYPLYIKQLKECEGGGRY